MSGISCAMPRDSSGSFSASVFYCERLWWEAPALEVQEFYGWTRVVIVSQVFLSNRFWLQMVKMWWLSQSAACWVGIWGAWFSLKQLARALFAWDGDCRATCARTVYQRHTTPLSANCGGRAWKPEIFAAKPKWCCLGVLTEDIGSRGCLHETAPSRLSTQAVSINNIQQLPHVFSKLRRQVLEGGNLYCQAQMMLYWYHVRDPICVMWVFVPLLQPPCINWVHL